MLLIATKISDPKLEKMSRLFVIIMALVLLIRVFSLNALQPFIFNPRALVDISFILMLGHICYLMRKSERVIPFFALLHIALMGILLREMHGFVNGQALVTVGWGILGLTVFIYGLRNSKFELRYLGALTIFIVIGKLFIVDLSELETIWRIILFIGFGGMLLIVSNYLSKLVVKKKEPHEHEK